MTMELPGHEIVGQRLVGALPSAELADVWCRTTSKIVKHGFGICYRDLESPLPSIFNIQSIFTRGFRRIRSAIVPVFPFTDTVPL